MIPEEIVISYKEETLKISEMSERERAIFTAGIKVGEQSNHTAPVEYFARLIVIVVMAFALIYFLCKT